MNKILIGVPMFNCQNQAIRVLNDLTYFLDNFRSNSFTVEQVIFLDNQSVDQTVSEVKSAILKSPYQKKIQVARNIENLGLGGSHKSLIQYSLEKKFTHLAIVHGDHQADAREFSNLITLSEKNNFCTVLGSRFDKKSSLVNYSKTRTFGNNALNIAYSFLLKRKITDLGSGLNFFSLKNLNFEKLLKFDNTFTFNMDLLLYLIKYQSDFLYEPISWKTEDEISNANSIIIGFNSILKVVRWTMLGEKIWKKSEGEYKFNFL